MVCVVSLFRRWRASQSSSVGGGRAIVVVRSWTTASASDSSVFSRWSGGACRVSGPAKVNARTTSSINNMCNEAALEFEPVSSSVHEVIREQSVEMSESRALNGRIWAFVASVGANSTPDIGGSIFFGHLRRCQCWCWQHQRWVHGHIEVFLHSLIKSVGAQRKHFCHRHRVPQDTHKRYVGNLDADRLGKHGYRGFYFLWIHWPRVGPVRKTG